MNIPVQNLYYLLAYAWDRLDEAEIAKVSAIEGDNFVELLGRVLTNGTAHVLKQGLNRGYVVETTTRSDIRGKIEVGLTIKDQSLARGQVACSFAELSYDVAHNRLIRETLERLARTRQIPTDLAKDSRILADRMHDVSRMLVLSSRNFRSVQLYRNTRFYAFLLDICRLLIDNLLPETKPGAFRFRRFLTKAQMASVFERFVFHFLRREQRAYKVASPQIPWRSLEADRVAMRFLPLMKSDIVLESESSTILIDTKYYSRPLKLGRFGKLKVRSTHLYQILTYMRHLSASTKHPSIRGLLLYAQVDEPFCFDYRIDG